MTMDRKKLEEAIRHVRQAIPWQYGLVADAAAAHLETLPKTKDAWRVGWHNDGSMGPYGGDVRNFDRWPDATAFLSRKVEEGARVWVERYEVPL